MSQIQGRYIDNGMFVILKFHRHSNLYIDFAKSDIISLSLIVDFASELYVQGQQIRIAFAWDNCNYEWDE